MSKKTAFSVFTALILVLGLTLSACSSARSSVQDGLRDGISKGVSGLFGGGRSSDSDSGGSGGTISSGGSRSGSERNYSGSSQTVPWPEARDWREYGLEGLSQPAGTDVTSVQFINPSSQSGLFGIGNIYAAMGLTDPFFEVYLINGGKPAFDNLEDQIIAIGIAGKDQESRDSENIFKAWTLKSGNSVWLSVDLVNGDIYIRVTQITQ